jgi:arsenate reductase
LATLFRENGIDFEQVNYFSEPLSADDVKGLLAKLQLPAFAVLRTRERQFKELGLSESTPEDGIIDAIVENPGLLNRPIVVVGDKAVIARPVEKALDLIAAG